MAFLDENGLGELWDLSVKKFANPAKLHVWRQETPNFIYGEETELLIDSIKNGNGSVTFYTFQYSEKVDTSLKLVNPQSIQIRYDDLSSGTVPLTFLNGKYWTINGATIYYTKEDGDNLRYHYYEIVTNFRDKYWETYCTAKEVLDYVPIVDYVCSDDPETFHFDDNYEYKYIGKLGEKYQSGRYKGTGTYGSDNPNVITFDFEPQIVFVLKDTAASNIGVFVNGHPYYGNASLSTATANVVVSFGDSISWYSSSAAAQYNESGVSYKYIAI